MRKGMWLFALLALLALPCASWSRNVSVVLVSGDVVKGKLLGSGDKGITLQTKAGKARTYPFTSVQDVFDTDTNENLSSQFLKKDASESAQTEEEAAPAPTPAPRVVPRAKKVVYTGPAPFKPGLSFGMDFTTGSRASNPRLTKLWKETVPEAGWDYTKLPLTDLGLELLYKPSPLVGFGVFGQWFIMSLGNSQTLTYTSTLYWYGYPISSSSTNYTFDISLGALAYGGMVRLRPSPDSRVALAFYAGQLSLAGSSYTVNSDSGTQYVDQTFSGHAPYFRGDVEFALVPDVSRVVPILSIGYQVCKMKNIHTIWSDEGIDGTWTDNQGKAMELDYSSLRIGFKVVGKF